MHSFAARRPVSYSTSWDAPELGVCSFWAVTRQAIRVHAQRHGARRRAERDQLATRNEKLEHTVAEMRRAMYGRRSEHIHDSQLMLALEALETAHAKMQAEAEKANPALKSERTRQRRKSRTDSLDHLPHEEVVIEPESKVCPCCNGALHVIGEDISKRLDKVPAKLTVVVTRRPKLACRSCERTGADDVAGIIQAPAPARRSRADCRPSAWLPMWSCRSSPIICRSIASRRSWRGSA